MDEEKDKDHPDEAKAEEGEEDDDGVGEEEKRKPDGVDEPPAFGVEGDGGDSSVLEAAKQEVIFELLILLLSAVRFYFDGMCLPDLLLPWH